MSASRQSLLGQKRRSLKPFSECLEGRALLSTLGTPPPSAPDTITLAEIAPELPTYDARPLEDLVEIDPAAAGDEEEPVDEAIRYMTLVSVTSAADEGLVAASDGSGEVLPGGSVAADPSDPIADDVESLDPDLAPPPDPGAEGEPVENLQDGSVTTTADPTPIPIPVLAPLPNQRTDPPLSLETLKAAFQSNATAWRASAISARPNPPQVVAPPSQPNMSNPPPVISRVPTAPSPTRPVAPSPASPSPAQPGEPRPVASSPPSLVPPLVLVNHPTTADQTPPQLASFTMRPRGRELLLAFTEPLDPTTASDPGNYRVEQISPQDYRLQTTPGDVKIAIAYPRAEVPVAEARYNEATRTVTLALRQPVRPGQYLSLSTKTDQPTGSLLRDRAGNPVDGNADGVPDGRLQAYLPRPRAGMPPAGRLPRTPALRLPPNFRRG